MKTFDKIKFDGVRVTIKYHEGAADDPQNETTYTSKDAPTPEFREALQALRADVIDICELPMQLYALDVRSVSFSHANDILGATITALYSLSKSNAPLVINTPHKSAEPYSEGGDSSQCLDPHAVARLKRLIDRAEKYLQGARAQGTLFDAPPVLDRAEQLRKEAIEEMQ